MTDRELLELAAKSSGLNLAEYREERNSMYHPFPSELTLEHWWNPLTDDGDALRLAVTLGLQLVQLSSESEIDGITKKAPILRIDCTAGSIHQYLDEDKYSATRRAIVRAAAEIGKAMK